MKPARTFPQVSRRFYRPEAYHCTECQERLHRAVTLSERTVITLDGVIKLVHAGYRCPDVGHQRTYRSAKADALALPWFTYGLDVVLLVGRLRLTDHQTVDEIHQEVLTRLEPLGVKIARREILYLFEAYCTLLRASSEAKDLTVSSDHLNRCHHDLSQYRVRSANREYLRLLRRCGLANGQDHPERDPACNRVARTVACLCHRNHVVRHSFAEQLVLSEGTGCSAGYCQHDEETPFYLE